MACKKDRYVANLVTENKSPCVFCRREVDEEIIYGKLYAIGDIQCHYFCVLLSCCLVQKGKDHEGLFGFMYTDIMKEVERSKKHKCSYCNRDGATIGCNVSQCRKQFHLPCGRERNALSLFYGNFKSYCETHAPKQKLPDHLLSKAILRMAAKKKSSKFKTRNSNNSKGLCEIQEGNDESTESDITCAICYETVDGFPTVQTFWPPCCARDAWFHRQCLQRLALSAGLHYLKCPLCNDKENFYEAVVDQGYYVPDRDAAWELEDNAFAEIHERKLICAADTCQCPMGRGHDEDIGSEWDIKACLLCGSVGMHNRCLTEQCDMTLYYVCHTCRPVAPMDLEQIQNAILEEQEQQNRSNVRRGPIMPSRMSLRRTKQRQNGASTSNASNIPQVSRMETDEDIHNASPNITRSRQELNLKTPKQRCIESRQPILKIENTLLSPVKLLEQGLKEKCSENLLDSKLIESVRRKFKKPKPSSVKRKILNKILEDLLKEKRKSKEPIREWNSPKKCADMRDEHLEINSEPIDSGIATQEKVSLKFSPQDKEVLEKKTEEKAHLDVETFKNQYLNEIDRGFKTTKQEGASSEKKNLKRKKLVKKARSKKRKTADDKIVVDVSFKIRFIDEKSRRRRKLKKKNKALKLKQCILQCSPDVSAKETIVKPEVDVKVLKRKYIKQDGVSPDKLKQTSIQSYFKVKTEQ